MSEQQVQEPQTQPQEGDQGQSVDGESAPESGKNVSNHVPYERFQEVIQQKNMLEQQNAQLSQAVTKLSEQSRPKQEPVNNQLPNFETAEDLVKYVEQRSDQIVQQKLEKAEQDYLIPLLQNQQSNSFNANVERYFAENPQATVIREEMDKYTAGLSQTRKEAIMTDVINGRSEALDEIFSVVASKNQDKLKNLSNRQIQNQANQAFSPQPYKAVKSNEPTIKDHVKKGIDQARKTGKGDFTPVWSALAHQEFSNG